MPDLFYKAVDADGLSFFPFAKADRVNWIELIGETLELGDEAGWIEALVKLKDGDTACCTKHLLHGYADIALAVDFGRRNAEDRPGQVFRIVEFAGEPAAKLEGSMLIERVPWDKDQRVLFADAVKYGFRSVHVTREVPEEEWAR